MDRPDADLEQMVEHDRGATVLEGAGRHLRFELETYFHTLPVAPNQRGPALAKRDARRPSQRQSRRVAPQGSLAGVDFAPCQASSRRQIEMAAAIAPPQRAVGSVAAPAGGTLVAEKPSYCHKRLPMQSAEAYPRLSVCE